MEPEAQRLIADNLYRNFIDHAEYPISAEIEAALIRMLADSTRPRRDHRRRTRAPRRRSCSARSPEVESGSSAAKRRQPVDKPT